jgi:hypothetical protein
MIRWLLVGLLVIGCRANPGLTRTVVDGVECWHFGDTGYVSCQPVEPSSR